MGIIITITIKRLPYTSSTVQSLVAALDAEVGSLYPDAADFPYQGPGQWLNGVTPPPQEPGDEANEEADASVYFVAFADEEKKKKAVGCVGVSHMPDFPFHRPQLQSGVKRDGEPVKTAEVKRMYVVPAYRGRERGGVARELLRYVEGYAREEMGVRRLVLETGMRQGAAMRLYATEGWTRRAEFGDYVGAGEEVGGLSRCWEKWVG